MAFSQKFKKIRPPAVNKKQNYDLVRKPPSLKEELGDNRFHWNTRRGRQHICDACLQLFLFKSQACPFDGQWLTKFPRKKSFETLRAMYWRGEHDFTWICTNCQYESSDYTDIDEFRKKLGIDFTKKKTRTH